MKNFETIDFTLLADAEEADYEATIAKLKLKENATWLLPQLTAHIANDWTLHKDSNGLYDPKLFLVNNIPKSDKFRVGIWKYFVQVSRSEVLPLPQTKMPEYCMLVPMFMMAYKKFKNIPYSSWSREGQELINYKLLADVMVNGAIEVADPILERKNVLTFKSGNKAGQQSNPISTWCPRSTKDTIFEGKPKLTATLALQLWCAHPTIRNSYMILDPKNWDAFPDPILSSEVLKETKRGELPW